MSVHVRDAGTWKQVNGLWVRDAGTWKEVSTGYVKDGGVWKEMYSSGPAFFEDFDGVSTPNLPSGWIVTQGSPETLNVFSTNWLFLTASGVTDGVRTPAIDQQLTEVNWDYYADNGSNHHRIKAFADNTSFVLFELDMDANTCVLKTGDGADTLSLVSDVEVGQTIPVSVSIDWVNESVGVVIDGYDEGSVTATSWPTTAKIHRLQFQSIYSGGVLIDNVEGLT